MKLRAERIELTTNKNTCLDLFTISEGIFQGTDLLLLMVDIIYLEENGEKKQTKSAFQIVWFQIGILKS